MADVVDSSDPQEMVDTVLQEIDLGVTPSSSISTPLVAELVDDSGPISQTLSGQYLREFTREGRTFWLQPKRDNTAKKNGGSSSSQLSPLTTRARARQKAGLSKVHEAAVDPIEELETDSEVDRSDTNARRTLWDGDMTTSRKEPGGAFVNIISSYTMTFGEALKRSFETHCYMENRAGFYICPFDETGNYVYVTEADKEKWDDLWRMESEAFDAECRSVPEYAVVT
ncbi:hypothetical protein R1sor_005441 [Riccia sorocarpa]|uniref:Uncharacterized protein n=1 Tax=Riccia sorocarpa TaxID=122646 RepID=A0ABD3HNY0_9MARC